MHRRQRTMDLATVALVVLAVLAVPCNDIDNWDGMDRTDWEWTPEKEPTWTPCPTGLPSTAAIRALYAFPPLDTLALVAALHLGPPPARLLHAAMYLPSLLLVVLAAGFRKAAR